MKLKERLLAWLRPVPTPSDPVFVSTLSRRVPRHEFVILQQQRDNILKVRKDGRVMLLSLEDWRFFKHELANFCQAQQIWSSQLQQGTVHIHCVGIQEYLPRGIKYTWRFNKL